MALSANDQVTLQTLRDKYFKVLTDDPAISTEPYGTTVERDNWPSDGDGPLLSTDPLVSGQEPPQSTDGNGYKAKIGPLDEGLQTDLNTLMDLVRTYGDSTP